MAKISHSALDVAVPINAYSQAIEANGFVFLSGQLAYDGDLDRVPPGLDAGEQTRRLMANIGRVLAQAGLAVDDIVKATLYLTDINDFMTVNDAYAAVFEGRTPPARSTLGVAFLGKGGTVEIEVVAARA